VSDPDNFGLDQLRTDDRAERQLGAVGLGLVESGEGDQIGG